MPRELTAQFKAELEAGVIIPALLLRVEFSASTLRLWNGIGDLVFNSETYLGNGWFQGFGAIKEEGEIRPTGMDISLTGIPQSLISLILSQSVQNKKGTLYLGFLNSSGAIIQDPAVMYEGSLDVPQLSENDSGPQIRITIENKLLDLDRPRDFRWTHEGQKGITGREDDKGFEHVESLQDWEGYWGKKKEDNKKRKRRRRRRRKRRGR